ncbi:MAG: hemolysin III family protein [Candidatus Omnitrophota bacterium]|nr:hemolysin III family protein [Candidatus Omnitrophota bacterium]
MCPQRTQTPGEEIANSITHGIGTALSVAALVILTVFAASTGDSWRIVSLSIYGATLIFLYLASTLYHGLSNDRAKRVFKILDHSSIYLLIAGTYTPVVLVSLRGPWGWTLFGLIWGIAVIGIVLEACRIEKLKFFSVLTYIAMGWLVVIALKPLTRSAPMGLIVWLLVGGLAYTLGTLFYRWYRLPFHHAIWHLFVMIGSAAHFFGLLFYISSG